MFQAPFRDDNGQAQTILNYVPWIIIKIQEGISKLKMVMMKKGEIKAQLPVKDNNTWSDLVSRDV